MEAIAFVLGFAALGLLALRFGRDSRDGSRTKEHEFAAHGLTRADLASDRTAPSSGLADPIVTRPYPTLAFIEGALGVASGALVDAADAALLEARARELRSEHWSDSVWMTGVVPEAAFRRVLAGHAPELLDAPVRAVERPQLLVASAEHERRTQVGDQLPQAPSDRAVIADLAGSPATA